MLKTNKLLSTLALALSVSTTPFVGNAAEVDECIAPASPGGGWDFTCRSVGKLLYDLKLTGDPVQVTNMPGSVGALAFANVAKNRADDNKLLVATSTVGVTQIAQGRYPGGIDTMRWLGMLGADVGILLVAKDSPYNSATELLEALKADPESIVFAGSTGIGGWDHIRALMLAEAAGIAAADLTKIRWVNFDGGGPAVTQLMGGHVNAALVDFGEIAGFIESGDAKALAVLSDEALPAPFDKLPTAKSQGLDVVGYNWRGFYTGGDVNDDDYNELVTTLQKLYDSDEWKETAKSNGLIPIWRGGDEFEAFVRETADKMTAISKNIGVIK